jgi:alanine racemase
MNAPRRFRTTPVHRVRDNVAVVDLDAIVRNYELCASRAPAASVLATVKADAYGHGAVPVARALYDAGVRLFSVATVEEGLELRRAGVEGTVLVLAGATWLNQPELLLDANLTPVLSSEEEVEILDITCAARGERMDVHLKLDTGLARVGVPVHDDPEEALEEIVGFLSGNVRVRATGVMTHFANADLADAELTKTQRDRFERAVTYLHGAGVPLEVVHMSNTAATLEGIGLPDDTSLAAWVRPGLGLYGYSPFADRHDQELLTPAMTWRAPIVARKRIREGDPVSYGSTWRAERETEIAVLGVGYADGYMRALSNKASVLVDGQRAPIRGRVCMDLTMVDVTEIVSARGAEVCEVGRPATLIGHDQGGTVLADELAEHAGTIPYEILTSVGARVPRVHVHGAG